MGQQMTVEPVAVGDVAIFDTNRSLTGQGFTPAGRPEGDSYPAQLADRLVEADGAIEHVYVQSNVVTARRSGGWDDAALAGAAEVIRSFFVFYPEAG